MPTRSNKRSYGSKPNRAASGRVKLNSTSSRRQIHLTSYSNTRNRSAYTKNKSTSKSLKRDSDYGVSTNYSLPISKNRYGTKHSSNQDNVQNKNRRRLYIFIICLIVMIVAAIFIATNANASAQEIKKNNDEINKQLDEQENKYFSMKGDLYKIASSHNMQTDEAKTAAKNVKFTGTRKKSLDVPLIYQRPELPCGCEAVALTNQLNYYGFNLSKTTIADDYLIYSNDDYVNGYVGSPYSEMDGATIMSPGLTATANRFLTENCKDKYAYDVSGREFEDLFAYVERGNPVQI